MVPLKLPTLSLALLHCEKRSQLQRAVMFSGTVGQVCRDSGSTLAPNLIKLKFVLRSYIYCTVALFHFGHGAEVLWQLCCCYVKQEPGVVELKRSVQ